MAGVEAIGLGPLLAPLQRLGLRRLRQMRLDSGSAKLLDDVAPAGGGLHGDGDLLTREPFGELIEPGPQALAGSRADLAAMQLAALHLYVVEGDLLSMYVETTYNVHVGPPQAPLFTRHGYGLTASASELGRSLFTKVLLALAFSCHLFCYSALYAAPSQSSLALVVIVGFVSMQFLWTPPRPTSRTLDGLYSIDKLFEDHRVVDVRGCEHYREWDAPSVRNKVALRALLSFIRRIRSGFRAPLLAGMEAESREARSQSIWSASPRRSRRTRCSFSHTPASCHSFKRRQQVMPDPHAISWGSISQGMPLFRTKTMPVRAARLSMRGLPPWGFGGSGGRSGSTVSHSSSVTSSLAMFSGYPVNGFVRLT